MAGAGYRDFLNNEVLTSNNVDTYLMQQSVMVFDNAAARTTALASVLSEGMVTYLKDTNTIEVYDGSAWVGATGDITGLTAGSGITITNPNGPVPTVALTGIDEAIPTDPKGAHFDGTALNLYGTTLNYASTPDAAALDITGDIDIRAYIAMDDWTPSVRSTVLAKWQTSSQISYGLSVDVGGTLRLRWSSDGTTIVGNASTVATGFVDGTANWVRATVDVDNGSSGNDLNFYTSSDGINWTQLGTTVTTAGTTSIFNSTSILEIGSRSTGTAEFLAGKVFRAQVLNGIGGTVAFDADFAAVPSDSFAFTESSTNAATVTLTTTRYSFALPNVPLYTTTSLAIGANNTYYQPFKVSTKAITVKHAAFEVTTAPASNTTVRVGIYAADVNMQPTGSILFSSDAITVSSAAAAIYRIRLTPLTLQPGNYLIAFNTGATGATYRYIQSANVTWPNTLGASVTNRLTVGAVLAGGALPSTGSLWNSRIASNGAFVNFVLLGW